VGVELIAAGTGRMAGVGRQTGWPSLDSPTASRYNAFSGRSPGRLLFRCEFHPVDDRDLRPVDGCDPRPVGGGRAVSLKPSRTRAKGRMPGYKTKTRQDQI